MALNQNRVLVGLSGGIDSAAVAYKLKKSGYDVLGISFKLYDHQEMEIKTICEKIDIPYYIYDYRNIFDKKVVEPFVQEYVCGMTPNPCVKCNQAIKFGIFFNLLKVHDANFIATGHYVKKIYDSDEKKYYLQQSDASNKDQSYFLYFLNQDKLKHLLFPLGQFKSKEETKALVSQLGIDPKKRKESFNICFTQNQDYRSFVYEYSKKQKTGNFIDTEGNVLGQHEGIYHYTIGQKRNLGISLDKEKYVVKIDGDTNEITLGSDQETYNKGLVAEEVQLNNDQLEAVSSFRARAKICQWGYFLPCHVIKERQGCYKVFFDEKVRAITPGQAVVFYDKTLVLGGGKIISSF